MKTFPRIAAALAVTSAVLLGPVAVDNEHRIWDAYGNRYWPAIYLLDRNGRVVYRHYGEGGYEQTERRIRELLGNA